MKNLIIVESPTKAKTIKNFLGDDYLIIASKGHVRDLPANSFGIKIEDDNFIPEYKISKDHSNIIKEIKEAAKKSEKIYIATDEDREGEAIGFHVAMAIGQKPESLPRIVFHEITKNAILNALENPRKIDLASVDAQQARRLLDRIVGYKLSPLLSLKIQKGLSAGRVQSSSLKLVIDKEREIRAFKSEEYWSIDALFKPSIEAELIEFKNSAIDKMDIKNQEEAEKIVKSLEFEEYKVEAIDKKERKSSPQPPFMTSTLQQSASSVLGFSPKKTMMIAQSLYEGVKTHEGVSGVITYMRTDSLNVAQEAIQNSRNLIEKEFGKKYLPAKPNIYATKNKGAQEAHEAIRPTILSFTPEIAKKYLSADELKLYTLIYNRFVASQMTSAIYESQSIIFVCKNGKFRASGRKLMFDGFYRILGNSDKDRLLPELEVGKEAKLKSLTPNQHFTEPPSRYSEASLIKKLESLGIGRPSTYAPTISLLTSRKYINVEKKQIVPTDIAFVVTELLETNFPEIVDSSFTSSMEKDLDEVAENQKNWQQLLKEFYKPFNEKVNDGKKSIQSQKVATPTGEKCPECESDLLLRKGRFGEFVACSGFPRCKYTKNIKASVEKEPKEVVKLDVKCPACGGSIVERSSRRGKFFGCGSYPKCKFISTYEPTNVKCPKCEYLMAKRVYKEKEMYECIKCKHKEDA
ncbi:MAG: type I DNA topoisomerase [Campylobacteraceae bacterium]|nr:type I DNA topoisomerase [Campylobacteraceae bacterium]